MRERLAQTAYWKKKFDGSKGTRHVRVALVTPDEGRDFVTPPLPDRIRKNYAIANTEFDATYVLNAKLQPQDRIKHFSAFSQDIMSWGGGGGG